MVARRDMSRQTRREGARRFVGSSPPRVFRTQGKIPMLKFVAARLIGLALAALVMVPSAQARPGRIALDARIAELSDFVRMVTGYEVKTAPRIVFHAQEQLDRMYFGDNYRPSLKGWIGALAAGGTIMLSDDFMLGRDDHILVHELTHFMQFESGKAGDGCAGRLEPEAYRVQDIFVAATGRGKRSDPLTVMSIVAACDGH
jgi:hypothetical protein